MSTLATVRNRIAEALQDTAFTSISAASVDAIINDAISYYKYHRYWFNESETTLTTTEGDPVLSGIPSDFLRELTHGGLAIYYANAVYPVEKISTEAFDAKNITGRGLPRFYTYRNGKIELYFYPNTAYSIKLRYLKDYAELVNDSDTNDFLTYGERMVRLNALSRIYAEYKHDSNMENYYSSRATDEENNLLKRSNALSGSGSIVKDSVLLS